jgi:hypothetical protein
MNPFQATRLGAQSSGRAASSFLRQSVLERRREGVNVCFIEQSQQERSHLRGGPYKSPSDGRTSSPLEDVVDESHARAGTFSNACG